MIPIVAIVGRPNVGKSTLFNRLAGSQLAIVHDQPGVTRDRHYADTYVQGRDITLVDTGGFDPSAGDPLGAGIARHVGAAIDEADVIVCVLDGATPAVDADRETVDKLRRADKPVVYVANKVDSDARVAEAHALYELGMARLLMVSGLHGRGMAELEAAVVDALPPLDHAEPPPDPGAASVPSVALVGRPNAGKSSLFNRLCENERSIVDDRPGTTTDPVDTVVEHDGLSYVLVDTAGVRRKARVTRGVEATSVLRSIRAVGRADVAVLVCDAALGVAEQDARLLGLCADRGRGVVVALNKVDLLSAKERGQAAEKARTALHFARWAPIVAISAKTGRGIDPLMRTVHLAHESFHKRVPTAELNRFFEEILQRQPPPTRGGRAPRLFYITQAETAPPVFVVMSSAPEQIRDSYRRFVQNQIRSTFAFEAVPLTVHFRRRSRRG